MNAGELIGRVARRSSIPATDPRYAGLLGDVNAAIHEWEITHPNGWDYAVRTVELTLTPDEDAYTWATIALLLDENTPDAGFPIIKVAEIDYTDTGGCRHTLERLPIRQLRDMPVVSSHCFPTYWAAEGERVIIWPPPAEAFVVEIRVVIGEIDLVNPTDSPIVPPRFHEILVQLARSFAYEAEQDDNAAQAARDRYTAGVRRAMASERPSRGAGRSSMVG